AARRKSTSPKPKFNESWIGGVRVKANSQHSGKRKTGARFSPAFSMERRSALLSHLQFGTRTLGLKITARSQANFDRRMPITLMRPNTESEIGRAAVARLRAKLLAAQPQAQCRQRPCPRRMTSATLAP